jgi:hypothetical protein
VIRRTGVDKLAQKLYNIHIHKQTGAKLMRTQTNKLIDMMDQGLISAEAVAEMALAYMSEDDVADMMLANDIIEDEADEEPEDEEWTPENADFNDPGSIHHY